MANSLRELLQEEQSRSFATECGTKMHARLRTVVIDGGAARGDEQLAARIAACPMLAEFFTPDAMTEVPVAGELDGRFLSRRIDRMIVGHQYKKIRILDYKSDVSRDAMRAKYVLQLTEYKRLMQRIYPGHEITAYILWTHDWQLEKIV